MAVCVPATTANATPSRSSPTAAEAACWAARIFCPDIDDEQSTMMTSSAEVGGRGGVGWAVRSR